MSLETHVNKFDTHLNYCHKAIYYSENVAHTTTFYIFQSQNKIRRFISTVRALYSYRIRVIISFKNGCHNNIKHKKKFNSINI